MKITCIALDDEPASLTVIEKYAEWIPFLDLQKTFVSVKETLEYLKHNKVDFIFLDIQMPDILGTDFARILQGQTKVIFTTAFSEYAVQSYEIQAIDYLLKPIEFDRFLQATNRIYANVSKRIEGQSSIFVKEGYDWVRVQLNEVQYIQSDTNFMFIHEREQKVMTRMTMAEMMTLLPSNRFIRVHKSYIVSIDRIKKIERHQITLDKVVIPIGKSYQVNIEQLLK